MSKKKKYQHLDIIPAPDSGPRKRKPKSKQRRLTPIRLLGFTLAALLIVVGILVLLLVPTQVSSPDIPPPTLVNVAATPIYTGEYIEDLTQNGDLLIAAGSTTLRLYESNQLIRLFDDYNFSNPMHSNRVSVAFRPGSNQFASLTTNSNAEGPNAELTIWDAGNGNIISRQLAHEVGFSNRYWGAAVAYSPDGQWLATGAGDATIALWDAETGEILSRIDADFVTGTQSLKFSADGNRLMATIYTGSEYSISHRGAGIQAWDIHDLQNPAQIFSQPLHVSELHWTAFSPDGHYFAATIDRNPENYDIVIWDLQSLTQAGTIALPHDGAGSSIVSLAFSPDNERLGFIHRHVLQVSSGPGIPFIEEINPKVFEWRTGQEIATGPAIGMKSAYELHFSPDGNVLQYVDANDNNLRRWHIGTDVVEMFRF